MKLGDVRYDYSSSEIVILDPKEEIEIIDLWSLRYYKIQQGVLQQNLSKFDNFETADNVCNHFNKLIDMLKKEETIGMGEKYPWLDDTERRKHMSDRVPFHCMLGRIKRIAH